MIIMARKRTKKEEQVVVVPAKTVSGARKEWKKQGLTKHWTLRRIRLATKKEYPYERTHGYKSYALIVVKKKHPRG